MHTLCVDSWRPCEVHSPNRFPVVACLEVQFSILGGIGPPRKSPCRAGRGEEQR